MPHCLKCGCKLSTKIIAKWLPGCGFLCKNCAVKGGLRAMAPNIKAPAAVEYILGKQSATSV